MACPHWVAKPMLLNTFDLMKRKLVIIGGHAIRRDQLSMVNQRSGSSTTMLINNLGPYVKIISAYFCDVRRGK